MYTNRLISILLFIIYTFSVQSQEVSFTIAVMSDTQSYDKIDAESEKVKNDVFDSQTDWIIENMEDQKIIFVSHAGDVVDRNISSQWNTAKEYLNKLHGKVPYAISLGNHDMKSSGDTQLFQEYFPSSIFEPFKWYGGYFENNTNSYQLLTSNNIDILFIHIECNAPDRVLDWANSILKKHSNRLAIITTHMFLGPRNLPIKDVDYFDNPKGIMTWHKTFGKEGNSPNQLWDKCFKRHKNIKMIINGDQSRTNTLYQKYLGDNGNIVHVMLNDYSQNPGGGLRLYKFLPVENKLKVTTYNTLNKSVVEKTTIVPDSSSHYFTITNFFRKASDIICLSGSHGCL